MKKFIFTLVLLAFICPYSTTAQGGTLADLFSALAEYGNNFNELMEQKADLYQEYMDCGWRLEAYYLSQRAYPEWTYFPYPKTSCVWDPEINDFDYQAEIDEINETLDENYPGQYDWIETLEQQKDSCSESCGYNHRCRYKCHLRFRSNFYKGLERYR